MDQHCLVIQSRYNGALSYWEYCGAAGRRASELRDLLALRGISGFTDGSRKRMKCAIDILVQRTPLKTVTRPSGAALPFRLGFWTLTIPGEIQDPREVFRTAFARFARWMRKKDILYIWKAELQKRGQVHYHLIVDSYVHWREVKAVWNRCLKRAGYLVAWGLKTGNYDPPSVDLRAVKSNRALTNYLLKYITKDDIVTDADKKRMGKVWGSSEELRGKRFSYVASYDEMEMAFARTVRTDENGRWSFHEGAPTTMMAADTKRDYSLWKRGVLVMPRPLPGPPPLAKKLRASVPPPPPPPPPPLNLLFPLPAANAPAVTAAAAARRAKNPM